jgi:hypothetical protein
MRNVKWGIFLAAASLLIGPSTAWACNVLGTVVCEGTDQPVEGVVLTFVNGVDSYDAPATDASGDFTIPLWGATFDVLLGGNYLKSVDVFDINSAPYSLPDPIEVPASLVPECQPQTACDTTSVLETPFSLDRPLGNPQSECAHFGDFVPVGEGFDVVDGTIVASTDAAFAIVKSGRAYYGVTVGVQQGDVLNLPDTKNAVSHVTYCGCPTTDEASARSALTSTGSETAGGCSSGSAGALALMGLAALLPRLRRPRR